MNSLLDGVKELFKMTFYTIGFVIWACVILVILGGVGYGVYSMYQSTLTPDQLDKQRQGEVAERTPHVYSKVDGCTVYIWKNGSYNSYFTRCDNTNKVVTEFSHSENCGKACTKKVNEKVETN